MKKALVCLNALALVASFNASSLAGEWAFYGSARMLTQWEEVDEARTDTGFDDSDLTWWLQSNSRIGARVKAGDIDARFEYGFSRTSAVKRKNRKNLGIIQGVAYLTP